MLLLLLSILFLQVTRLPKNQELHFWIVLGFFIYIPSFLVGLSFWYAMVLFLFFSGYRIWQGARSWDKDSTLAVLLALPFLLTASMPTRFLDAGTYYEQSARWFEVGIPQGIGNLNLFLMQSSWVHSLEAFGNVLLGGGQNEVSVVIGVFLLTNGLVRLLHFKWRNVLVLGVSAVFLTHFTQAASPDFFIIALLVFTFAGIPKSAIQINNLVALLVVLPFIKPVGIAIAVLLGFLVLKKFQKGHWVVFVVAGLCYAFKLSWTSGFLPLVDIPIFAAQIPEAAKEYLKYRGQFYEYSGRTQLPFNSDLLFLLPYFIIAFFHIRSLVLTKVERLGYIVLHLTLVILWATGNPAARYLVPLILLMVLLKENSEQAGRTVRNRLLTTFVLSAGLFSVLMPWSRLVSDTRIQRWVAFGGLSQVHWLSPAPLWQPETKAVVLPSGFQVNVPKGPFKCYDATFPCTSTGVQYYGGDSIYYPDYSKEKHVFFYQSQAIDASTQALIDATSSEPQLPLGY